MDFEKLATQISGPVILPGDAQYDEERQLYNGMIDRKPGAIVKCQNTEDISLAVRHAQSNNLEVSIRSGGHNGAGLGLCDDGLAIDLSLMKGIKVDEENNTAVVEAGCLLEEIDAKTHEYGLALPTGIVGSTGIGGITLGGGLGYLSRKCGLTIDSLLEAEVILADGSVVTASQNENPDLLWALKGGGGNFGVVSSFTFQLHEISEVYAGPMLWSLDLAKEAMIFYRDLMAKADNDLYGFFAFLKVPTFEQFPEDLHGQNLCGVVWNYTGPVEKREEVFKPIREFGPPILDFVGTMPLAALQGMFDPIVAPGWQWYWKSDFFSELTEDAMDKFIEHGSNIPLDFHSAMHLYPIDGKVHEIPADATAWAHRDAKWAQVIVGVDPDPANRDIITNWAKSYYEATHPYASEGTYVNFMMEEKEGIIERSYGSNLERLKEVKRTYDPDNFFHLNQNIKPQ